MLSRSFKQALAPKNLLLSKVLTNQVRLETTSANVPSNLAEATKKDSHQLVISEPTEVVTADIVSGAPGGTKGDMWRIDFDILQGGGRWENPLMGWASSADYVQGTRLLFKTKEDAVHFAEKQGWDYYVQQPTVKRIPPKNYSENYVYSANKLRIAHTK
ncbi:hypothetical protein FRB99_002104 [Tulasnella sp. 403]|nr:hypothetical protein FRB99_002104 [Tulasnella sp. 403]